MPPPGAAHRARAEPGWLRSLLLGHARHAAGDTAAARELWAQSVAANPTPDAHRALALTSQEPDDRADALAEAHRLDPTRRGVAVEAATALVEAGRHRDALRLIDALPPELAALPRIQYLECLARVETGDAEGAAALLALPLVLPDLREGDVGLDQLWDKHQALIGGTAPLPAHYDFRMQEMTEESHGSH